MTGECWVLAFGLVVTAVLMAGLYADHRITARTVASTHRHRKGTPR